MKMFANRSLGRSLGSWVAVMLISAAGAAAQSTIFNVPSTDVVAEKRAYVEADFVSHLKRFGDGGFQVYGVRGVFGVGKNVEVGANVFTTRFSDGTPVELQPNVKWQAYNNEKHEVAISTGAIVFVPLNKIAGSDTEAVVYTTASKGVTKLNHLRLTGGAYAAFGGVKTFGSKVGAIVGVEQPLFKRVNFLADWYSGKNRLGYAAAGFGVSVAKRQTLFVGYNFGNAGRGNNSLGVFYGVSF